MDTRLSRVMERLVTDLSKRPRLPALAKEAGISIRQLELLFHTQTGKPFSAFYRELRMAHAQQALAMTDDLVKQVAAQLGYRTVAVFCRDFKRVVGCTAMEFRRHIRKGRLQKKSIDSH